MCDDDDETKIEEPATPATPDIAPGGPAVRKVIEVVPDFDGNALAPYTGCLIGRKAEGCIPDYPIQLLWDLTCNSLNIEGRTLFSITPVRQLSEERDPVLFEAYRALLAVQHPDLGLDASKFARDPRCYVTGEEFILKATTGVAAMLEVWSPGQRDRAFIGALCGDAMAKPKDQVVADVRDAIIEELEAMGEAPLKTDFVPGPGFLTDEEMSRLAQFWDADGNWPKSEPVIVRLGGMIPAFWDFRDFIV